LYTAFALPLRVPLQYFKSLILLGALRKGTPENLSKIFLNDNHKTRFRYNLSATQKDNEYRVFCFIYLRGYFMDRLLKVKMRVLGVEFICNFEITSSGMVSDVDSKIVKKCYNQALKCLVNEVDDMRIGVDWESDQSMSVLVSRNIFDEDKGICVVGYLRMSVFPFGKVVLFLSFNGLCSSELLTVPVADWDKFFNIEEKKTNANEI
jgi:hypothetical protein